MEDYLRALREIARVTKSGGVISIGSEPNGWIYKFRSIKHSRIGRKIMSFFRKDYTIGDQPPGDRSTLGWSLKDWGRVANQCDLELVKVTPIWYINGFASLLGLHSLPPWAEELFCKADMVIEKIPGLRNFSFKWNVVFKKLVNHYGS